MPKNIPRRDKRDMLELLFNPPNTDAKATELGHFDSDGYPTNTYLGSYGRLIDAVRNVTVD